jgi:hypothetical protein
MKQSPAEATYSNCVILIPNWYKGKAVGKDLLNAATALTKCFTPKQNDTDLRKKTELSSEPINFCAGGLGEALRPPVGGLGGSPPSRVFLINDDFWLNTNFIK